MNHRPADDIAAPPWTAPTPDTYPEISGISYEISAYAGGDPDSISDDFCSMQNPYGKAVPSDARQPPR